MALKNNCNQRSSTIYLILFNTFFICFLLNQNHAFGETKPTGNSWITNGAVQAVANDGDTIYIGGDFTVVGPVSGHGVPMNSAPAVAPVEDFPFINGPVYAALVDGSGGWYLGGEFTKVGDEPVSNLVHITSARTVDKDFKFSSDGRINSLAHNPDKKTLYVGGNFTKITYLKGTVSSVFTRANIAELSIDPADVKVTNWDPGTNGEVKTLTISKDNKTIYLGGNFTSVQSNARQFLATVTTTADAIGNYITAWAPQLTGIVNDIELAENSLFVGGNFGIVAYKNADGTKLWEAMSDGPVNALAYQASADWLYAGGEFLTVSGQARSKIVALKGINGEHQTSFRMTVNDGGIFALALSSSDARLYVGGTFTRINDSTRYFFAGVGTDGKLIGSFQPHAMGAVRSLYAPSGSSAVFVGGDFISVGGALRTGIAALSKESGEATSWDPKISGGVVKSIVLASDKSQVYIGGTFTHVLEKPRAHLAKLPTRTVAVSEWNPGVDPNVADSSVNTLNLSTGGGRIQTLVIDPKQVSTLYAGTSNGIYKSTDNATSWNILPGVNNTSVNQIIVDPTIVGKVFAATTNGLYVSTDGGANWQLTNLSELQKNVLSIAVHPTDSKYVLAGISKTDGVAAEIFRSTDGGATWAPLPFTPAHENVTALIFDNKASPITAYASGSTGIWKTTDNGATWKKVRDLTAPVIKFAIASSNNSTIVYAAASGNIYISQDEGASWSTPRQGLVGTVTDIAVPSDDPNAIIATTSDRGIFRSLSKGERWGSTTGQFSSTSLLSIAIDPSNATMFYVGGTRALIYKSIDSAFTWTESHEGIPNELLYIGGKFSSVDNQPRNNVAAVETSDIAAAGNYVANWNPGADGEVLASKITNDNRTLYIGGNFNNVAVTPRQNLASIDAISGNLLSWNPGANATVTTLALTADNRSLYVGGDFTSIASAIRIRLAVIEAASGAATEWNPNSNGIVQSIALSNDEKLLFVAGDFSQIDNINRTNLASLITNRNANYVTSWNPAPTPAFDSNNILSINGSTLYVGGKFQTISGLQRNNFASFTFVGPVIKADPIAGSYNRGISVSLKCELSSKTACGDGFQITYSVDDSPTYITYTTPITLDRTQTINAIALDDEGISSALVRFIYSFDYEQPTTSVDLASGTFSFTKTVGLICTDAAEKAAGCLINFYTTDGSTPSLTTDVKLGQDVMFVNDQAYGVTGTTKFLVVGQRIPILVDTYLKFSSIDKAGNIGPINTAQYKIDRGEGSGNVDWYLLLILGAALCVKLQQYRTLASRGRQNRPQK